MKRYVWALLALLVAGCATATAVPEPSADPTPEATAETSPSASATAEEGTVIDTELLPVDYSDEANWCRYQYGNDDTVADVFLLTGTVYETPVGNVALTADQVRREQALVNRMEGMVLDNCTMYSPAYRQITLESYVSDQYETLTANAYNDVRDAFQYYLEHDHKAGRPLVLFGYSSGAELSLKLAEEFLAPDTEEARALRDDLVAVYLIGWGVTEDVYTTYPNLKAAQSADDLGVLISFDAEAPEVTDSLILKEDKTYVSINPLNWKTDSTKAEASENKGAVLVNAKGEIKQEIAELCGAYLDETSRHALKVEGLDPETFPNTVSILPEGSYHVYDIVLFYRNIQENVTLRINQWIASHS